MKSTYLTSKQQRQTAKKVKWFSKIESREDAERVVKGCAFVFFIVAAIQTALSFIFGYLALVYAAIYIACGFFIRKFHSRVAAIIALLLTIKGLFVTLVMVASGIISGSSIFPALAFVWCAMRAVEATFKLHGKYSQANVQSKST
ncbi:MAG TPA: hypothetical protein V6C84_06810 [Coleofasciculaceae cyanobacterium]|jgi:hypothetical protein